MALDSHGHRYIRQLGDLTGKRVLTLGRLTDATSASTVDGRGFAEQAFPGASVVHSIDCSPKENPTFVADLNDCVKLEDQYDLVWDSGTIEHVFDIAQALRNIAGFLAPGGIFVAHQLLNLVGHGFWTIAPEALDKWAASNGFINRQCVAYRLRFFSGWRKVELPPGRRTEFFLFTPAMYFFQCQKPLSNPVPA